MNSRRKFLMQGGLATTGLIAAKPLETFAKFGSPFGFFSNNITLLHTHDIHATNSVNILKENSNCVLLNTSSGNKMDSQAMKKIGYDATLSEGTTYQVINRGSNRIGVIISTSLEDQSGNTVEALNGIALMLKKDKGCNLVVCLSDFGYQNKQINDLLIATQSKNIDVIIGSQHCGNDIHLPAVVLNKDKEEVVLNNSGYKEVAIGKIQIGFDSRGNKKSIRFENIFTGAQAKFPRAPIA